MDTEISIALPEGHAGLIFSRSSSVKKYLRLANSVGVVDSGYRGNVKIPLIYDPPTNHQDTITIKAGERIAQLVIVPIMLAEFEETEILESIDDRHTGGFGSSGV